MLVLIGTEWYGGYAFFTGIATVPLCFYFQGASEFTLWRGCLIIFKYNYYEKRLMMLTISFAFSVFLFTMTDIDSAVSDVRFALSIIS